jgi:DNA segregation ATPase FtsK/SpoIIIE-like protein
VTLPTFAEIPTGMPPTTSIPLGLYDGGVQCWNPDVEPHMLLTGRTRTGKTSLVRTVIKGLSERGALLVLIDPKRSALVDVATLPGVLGRATSRDLDDVAHKIGWVERRMMERYDLLEAGHSADAFPRLVLVVDEGRLLYELTKTHWNTVVKPREIARAKAVKSPHRPVGTEHPCIEQIRSILRLGGEAKVSVILISQQADASWLSTEARQNLGMRVALGNMDDDGLGMMFGRRTRLEPLPSGEDGMPIKGRAYVATVGQQPIQMQAFWTPEIPRTGPTSRDLPTQPIPVQQPRRGILQRLLG